MCDTHEAIIKSLAEELGCECLVREHSDCPGLLRDPWVVLESGSAPKSSYTRRWLTSKGLMIDVGIVGDKLWLYVPLRMGGSRTRIKPLFFELSHPHNRTTEKDYHCRTRILTNGGAWKWTLTKQSSKA